MNNTEKIKQAAEILSKAKNIVGFTGAGTSAESGIPPFRGEGGIWNQYDPNSLDIDFYYRHTKESWKIIREVFYNFFSNKDITDGRQRPAPSGRKNTYLLPCRRAYRGP